MPRGDRETSAPVRPSSRPRPTFSHRTHRRPDRPFGLAGDARAAGAELVAASGQGPVAVIGAGGVGKAIAFALAGLGVSAIRLFDTDRGKAASLASGLGDGRGVTVADSVADALRGAVGLVNATPI